MELQQQMHIVNVEQKIYVEADKYVIIVYATINVQMVEVEQIVNVKIVINVQLLKLAKNRNVMVYVNISDNAGICIDSDQSSSKDISSLDYKSLKLSSEYN